MSLLASVVEIVVTSLAVAGILTLAVRTGFSTREKILSNEGGSPALRAITATYALLLAFVLATSLQSFQSARQQSVTEADTVVSLGNLAVLLPAPAHERIDRALSCYAQTVAYHEFPVMQAGKPITDNSAALTGIYRSLPNLDRSSQTQISIGGAVLQQLSVLTSARDARIRAAHSHLPPLLWVVVLGGAAIALLALTAVTFVDRPWPQFWLLSGATAIVLASILLISSLGSPFKSQAVTIDAGPMRAALMVVSTGVPRPYC